MVRCCWPTMCRARPVLIGGTTHRHRPAYRASCQRAPASFFFRRCSSSRALRRVRPAPARATGISYFYRGGPCPSARGERPRSAHVGEGRLGSRGVLLLLTDLRPAGVPAACGGACSTARAAGPLLGRIARPVSARTRPAALQLSIVGYFTSLLCDSRCGAVLCAPPWTDSCGCSQSEVPHRCCVFGVELHRQLAANVCDCAVRAGDMSPPIPGVLWSVIQLRRGRRASRADAERGRGAGRAASNDREGSWPRPSRSAACSASEPGSTQCDCRGLFWPAPTAPYNR